MFYSNEVYLANYSHTRLVDSDFKFKNHSLDDILIDGEMIRRVNFLPTIKSRLFRLVDVLDIETDKIENHPNVVLKGIYSNITLIARARDILFCTRDCKDRLPTIRGYGEMSTMLTHPWCEETDIIHRDNASYYITEEYMNQRNNSIESRDYTSWFYTNKFWKSGRFVDRFDYRVSMPNRFYLDKRAQMVLHKTYSSVNKKSIVYYRCHYCRESNYLGKTDIGQMDFVCRSCCVEVEVPCGACLSLGTIDNMYHRDRYSPKRSRIYEDMGVEFLHSRCANYLFQECFKCKKIEKVNLDYIHSIDGVYNRKLKLREFINGDTEKSRKYFNLEQNSYCTSCANLHLNHRLYAPYRASDLPEVIHMDNTYTRHTGIESEVITQYENRDDYERYNVIPSNFEVVSDGSLSDGGVEYRTSRPLVGSEVSSALSDLEKAHRDHDNFTDASCGIHIHMNAIDFGFVEIKNLLMIISSIQDSIYESMPVDRRDNEYAKRIDMSPREILEIGDLPTLVNSYYNMSSDYYNLNKYNSSRYIGTNIHARFYLGTVEFRYHEGEIYSPPIRSWIKFLNRLMDASKDLHLMKKLYQQVLSNTSNAMEIIDSIGGRESTEYIEKRINENK